MSKERLAYLQWALKPGDTQLLNDIVSNQQDDINTLFDKIDIALKKHWEHWVAMAKLCPPLEPLLPPREEASAPSVAEAQCGSMLPTASEAAVLAIQSAPKQTPSAQTAPLSSSASAAQSPIPLSAPAMLPLRFHIKNARQGEPFDATIAIQPENVKPRLRRIDFPEGMGLAVDLPDWRVHGTPERSGEFQLAVEYYCDEVSLLRSGVLSFIVNPDPKTLWEDKPSDRNAPFWKADTAHDCAQGSDARIVAARRRGRSHAHKGTCCDDDYSIYADPLNGWQLAIVADGAGSAKFSRLGSQVATAAAAEFLRQALAGQAGEDLRAAILGYADAANPANSEKQILDKYLYITIGYAAHTAATALHKKAREHAGVIASVKELSTTLLIGLARKIDSRWFCAAYWVGDGAVAVYRENTEVILLGEPDSGEFSGQTRFLTAEEVQQDSLRRRLRFTVVEDMTAFILMTDGVSDAKFQSEAQLGQLAAWDAFWADLGKARLEESGDVAPRLLDWLDFWATGEYDDRTIAIIY
ncbi:MAG: protein phosphatase 2C domain-containing protein [Azoarcus sp.]|nr:protein phosphatase 2C domain-containing protein [Azoarcus sp.]